MFSIKSKIIFAYTTLFGILLIVFAVIIYQSIKQNSIRRLDANLISYSNILQTEMEEEINEKFKIDGGEIKSLPSEGLYDVRIQLFDKGKGKIISDSLLADKQISLKNFTGRKFETLEINGAKYRSFITQAEEDMDSNLVLQTAASLKNVEADLNELLLIFSLVIPFALVITGLTAFIISKRAFMPVTQMAETANQVSINRLDKRLKLPDKEDEIFILGKTLNEMIERIDEAVKSQKQFIADASHEIKTPLTIIQTELELAEKENKELPAKENIEIALYEIERLNRIVSSLFTLVKLDSPGEKLNISQIRLDELLIDCYRVMKRTADENGINLQISISDPIEIFGDEDKLKSVFVNLIDNGIKYSGKNSSVIISVKNYDEKNASVSIADNGKGLNEEELANIFKRFYRSNEIRSESEGNGLGLSIVKRIVELHNGKILSKSKAGKGSEFIVIIPINNTAA